MSSWQGPPVLVGEKALWLGCGSGLPRPGIVKWIGHLPGIGPDWTVGLELDEALPVGGIDGSWGGRVLFTCRPKHGLLVPIASIIPGSQLKHLPPNQNFEQSQNAADVNSKTTHTKHHESMQIHLNSPQLNQEKGLPRSSVRHKRRIATPPPSDVDESSLAEVTDAATLRVEEVGQEDSLKKRLRLFADNNGAVPRMNGLYKDYALQEVVIDSLYAQRHQQFVKHGRSQSESTHAFVSSSNSANSRRERNSTSAIFSIFRWFRKESKIDDYDPEFAPSAPSSPQLVRGLSSSCNSVDTLFSTATASSFAFVHPALYRPFGAANAPEKRILPGPDTETYRNRLKQRDRIRELDRNLTLKKKYHLFGSDTLHRSADDVNNKSLFLNKSLDSLKSYEITPGNKNSTLGRKKRKAPSPPATEEKFQERNITSQLEGNKENSNVNANSEAKDSVLHVNRPRHRRTVSDSAKDRKSGAFVHVKGKRKAPPPPNETQVGNNKKANGNEIIGTQSLGRKKRPAPLPPLEIENGDKFGSRSLFQNCLDPEEKQKLIENIAKLQAHADRTSLFWSTPPDSPTSNTKMSHTVCNDSLKLERGVLKANKTEVQSTETKSITPTPVSPRPWYKRNNKEKSLEKKKEKNKIDDWMPEVSILRGNMLNQESNNCVSSSNSNSYRLSSIFSRFEKPEEKRKSQISMLANISELDREAAEIVQKEQEKERAVLAAHDAKYYTSVDHPVDNLNKLKELEPNLEENASAVEDSDIPRRSGARELISLFNALGNMTKVTVNSAFFAREGPSIFTKEGIEKRFSTSGETVRTSEEIVVESISKGNKDKTETVFVETKETYLESPGIKRRRNFLHQNAKDDDSSSSVSSEAASPKVVIEEVEDFDTEKSKLQSLYEANKIRKHHSPSPSIPAIAEMSESVSSVATSPGSTLNPSDRSKSATPIQITPTAPISVASSQPSTAPSSKNYSIWSCPRCTLENPRWRVTCEACDMWRPAVRKDVIDKLTNANMGTTIAVNVVKTSEVTKNNNVTKSAIPSQTANSDYLAEANTVNSKTKVQLLEKKETKKESNSKIDRSKPITVSGLLSSDNYNPKNPTSSVKESTQLSVNNSVTASVCAAKPKQPSVPTTSACSSNIKQNKIKSNEPLLSRAEKTEEASKPGPIESESEMEELRKARLAFFEKSQVEDERKKDETNSDNTKKKSTISQAKIDALFSIASKGSLATNEEERLKVKEILKEMKNSLPKKSQQIKPEKTCDNVKKENGDVIKENIQVSCNDAARLGAIRKSTVQSSSHSSNNVKKVPTEKQKEKKAEIYLVKSETIIEEIKVKAKDDTKSPKVSTSVQTNGVIRKVEPNMKKEETKLVTGKPPTPKASRKDVIVPVTVEEHVVKDGEVLMSTSKEPRKMGIGTFELIRPRDFATIEATKTGSEVRAPHVYANVPSTHIEESSASPTSSLSSESQDVNQWTTRFSKPKGLADFKAAVLESTAGNKMSTLAVNRLLKHLESAIAGGQHERAATLAQELARHKVSCSVIRHQQPDSSITLDMFVEDKLSHQGPFPLQVSPSITVVQLKAKVEREFEIPVAVQRWILGKELATDDTATLQQLGVSRSHCPVFLYLVAPDGAQEKATAAVETQEAVKVSLAVPVAATVVAEGEGGDEAAGVTAPAGRGWYFNEEDDRYSFCESEATDSASKEASPQPPEGVAADTAQEVVVVEEEEEEDEEGEVEIEEVEEEEGANGVAETRDENPSTNHYGTLRIGWKCAVCTLVNAPTRPGCMACAADRPADYVVPSNYEAGAAERLRLDHDLQAKQMEADEKRQNYERLMVLESADLIPTTEPFECSVCLSACEAADGVVLRDCLHVFCRACLAHTVQYTDDAEVKCPFRDHNYACDSTLQEREIKAVCEEEDSCIVCMAEPRCCALTPCGHRAYCETCCLRLIELGHLCSLCRRAADGYLVIYL